MLMRNKRLATYILIFISLALLLITLHSSPVVIASTLSPSPRATEYGGGHGRIAFQMYRNQTVNLYTVDMNGFEKTLVTGNMLLSTMLVWSPSGDRVAFSSLRRSTSYDAVLGDIYVVNADGSKLQRLTHIGGISPSWSSAGSQIAFASNDGIYIINSNGLNLRRVANGPTFAGHSVLWSPDGKYIAFISSSTTTDQMEIYVLDIITTQIHIVTNNRATIDSFAWSPDSQSIVFSSNRDNPKQSDIYITHLTDNTQRRLTENNSYNTNPVWSPDGTSIAFVLSDNPKRDIYTMDTDGGNPHKLVSGQSPVWSPDGTAIAFVSFQDDGFRGISIVSRDGSTIHNLVKASPGDAPSNLAWQP